MQFTKQNSSPAVWIILACIFFQLPVTVGQTLVSLRIQPSVIVPTQTATILLKAQTAGTPSRVTFESAFQSGLEVDMKDDGTGGDAVAGDGIYTIALSAAPIVAAMQSDDVY